MSRFERKMGSTSIYDNGKLLYDENRIVEVLNQQDEEIKKLKKDLFDLKNNKLDSIFYGFKDHLEKTIIDKMEIK